VTYPSRATQYRELQVLSASPARLTVLLFEHLEVVMRRAQTAIRNDQIELRVANLGRAREILSELLGTLDIDRGGEIAVDLSMLYGFVLAELVDVGIRRDAIRLGRLIGIVNTLSTAFALAAKQLDDAAHATPLAASA
jgi:flagellar secretion chaperone FliS